MSGPDESDDDRTQLMPSRQAGGNAEQDRTVIARPNPGGFAMPPLRGQVIGTDARQQPGTPPPGGRPAGAPLPPQPAQDATIFVTPQAGALPGAKAFEPVVGWLVITKGPGRGEFRP